MDEVCHLVSLTLWLILDVQGGGFFEREVSREFGGGACRCSEGLVREVSLCDVDGAC